MPVWVWIAAGVAVLPLCLSLIFRVHIRLDWDGGKKWSADLEYGFPGFRRNKSFPIPAAPESASAAVHAKGQAGFIRLPRFHFDKERLRRALFRFLTDGPALGAVTRYTFRVAGLFMRLLHPTVECAVGNPDPLQLARICSVVHTARVLPFMQRVQFYPRFQDRTSTLRVRVRGGFSAAHALVFFLAALWAFPAFTLLRRAWHGWQNAVLTGWRGWAFARIKKAGFATA